MQIHEHYAADVFFGESDGKIDCQRGNSSPAFSALEDQYLPRGSARRDGLPTGGCANESFRYRSRGDGLREEFASSGAHGPNDHVGFMPARTGHDSYNKVTTADVCDQIDTRPNPAVQVHYDHIAIAFDES